MFAFQERSQFGGRSDLPVVADSNAVYSAFDVPREVGCFSIDSAKRIHFDRSQLKYYIPVHPSSLPLDLNFGYAHTIRKEFNRAERMEQLLRWISQHGSRYVDKRLNDTQTVDFVTLRGTLQKVMCTPFNGPSWTIIATKFKGVIYFYEDSSDAERLRMLSQTERDRRMSSWGYKFEQYMTAASPYGAPDMNSTTHEVEEFSVVLHNRMKNHKLLYKAEVDGMKCSDAYKTASGDPSCYVEMKTSKISPTFRTDFVFRKFKSAQWWAQSYVVGIQEIVCGMRDDSGYVRSVEVLRTADLPGMCTGFWHPNGCFNFCDRFLTFLKENIVEDNHKVVYRLVYTPGSPVVCQKSSYPANIQIIPEWFTLKV